MAENLQQEKAANKEETQIVKTKGKRIQTEEESIQSERKHRKRNIKRLKRMKQEKANILPSRGKMRIVDDEASVVPVVQKRLGKMRSVKDGKRDRRREAEKKRGPRIAGQKAFHSGNSMSLFLACPFSIKR